MTNEEFISLRDQYENLILQNLDVEYIINAAFIMNSISRFCRIKLSYWSRKDKNSFSVILSPPFVLFRYVKLLKSYRYYPQNPWKD